MLTRPLRPVLPVRSRSITPVAQQHFRRLHPRQTTAFALLGIQGLDQPKDIESLAEGITSVLYNTQRKVNGVSSLEEQADEGASYFSCAQQQLQAACSCLEFIKACHPDSAWRAAAQEALQQLSSTAVYLGTAAAAAAAANQQQAGPRSMHPPSSTQRTAESRASAGDLPQTRGRQQLLGNQSRSANRATLQQLLQHAEQLNSWVTELHELQAATAAAATAIAHDPDCAPVLLLDPVAAQMHPLWSKDYAAWSAAAPAGGGGDVSATLTPATAATAAEGRDTASEAMQAPRFVLPAQPELHVGQGASLSLLQHYRAAVAAPHTDQDTWPSIITASATHHSASGNSSSNGGSSAAGSVAGSEIVLPWPLTSSAVKVLLGSPLGVLPGPVLHQVYCLGLLGRVSAFADAVDLARLVGGELAAAQAEQQQVGQQLTQQLQELHRAVQSGAAVDPVAMAAVASATATTGLHSTAAAAAAAADTKTAEGVTTNAGHVPNEGVHPAVAVAFLRELAAFGKGAAADELQSWLDACRSDPALCSYLSTMGASSQLPAKLKDLQPHMVDALRETVALAQSSKQYTTNRGRGTTDSRSLRSSGSSSSNSSSSRSLKQQQVLQEQEQQWGPDGSSSSSRVVTMDAGAEGGWWLQDYTHLHTLLPRICSVLGDCFQLDMTCAAAERDQTWCEEAYVITVSEQQPARHSSSSRGDGSNSSRGGSSSGSSGSSAWRRGAIWLLFDDTYQGMPATHLVSPGVPAVAAAAAAAQSADVPVNPKDSSTRALPLSGLVDGLHTPTVAVVFPASFCSVNRGLGSSTSSSSSSSGGSTSSSSSSSSGSSAFSVLQSVLHELGHALHFLLSASACVDAPAAACGASSSLEVMETASHLLERMTRSPVCMQALLRHHTTQQPPNPALTQQLLTYTSISSRGVLQWHQHVLAALADAQLATAAAAAAATPGAAAAAEGHESASSASCWAVLQSTIQQYDPLAASQHSCTRATYGPQGQTPAGAAARSVPVVSSAMLEHLSAMAVLQPGDMYAYVCADLLAAALWGTYLQDDPLDPAAWLTLRQGLFERDAKAGTVAVFEALLGPGSMMEVAVQLQENGSRLGTVRGGGSVEGAWGVSVSGCVPNLEHLCFQDIDLWG